jgi:hypothetical protein
MWMADSKESIRIRLDPDLLAKWRGVLEGRKITQQQAIVATIRWLVKQDSLLQGMVFDQIEEKYHGQLVQKVLKSLAGPKAKRQVK